MPRNQPAHPGSRLKAAEVAPGSRRTRCCGQRIESCYVRHMGAGRPCAGALAGSRHFTLVTRRWGATYPNDSHGRRRRRRQADPGEQRSVAVPEG